MNSIKKLLGIVWMLLGPAAIYFMVSNAATKIGEASAKIGKAADDAARVAANAAHTNIMLQWSIIIAIFVPIMIGMVIFGYYAFQGAYETSEA